MSFKLYFHKYINFLVQKIDSEKCTLSQVVVVAQLVERLLPTQEVRGLTPVIGKIYIGHLLSTVLKRRQ